MQFMECVPIEAYRLIVNSIHSLFEAVARTNISSQFWQWKLSQSPTWWNILWNLEMLNPS